MGKMKQMMIDIDDDYVANILNDGEDVEEPVEDPEANFESLCEEVKKTYSRKIDCEHNVKITSFKKEFATFCTKCGKILSVRHKKARSK